MVLIYLQIGGSTLPHHGVKELAKCTMIILSPSLNPFPSCLPPAPEEDDEFVLGRLGRGGLSLAWPAHSLHTGWLVQTGWVTRPLAPPLVPGCFHSLHLTLLLRWKETVVEWMRNTMSLVLSPAWLQPRGIARITLKEGRRPIQPRGSTSPLSPPPNSRYMHLRALGHFKPSRRRPLILGYAPVSTPEAG